MTRSIVSVINEKRMDGGSVYGLIRCWVEQSVGMFRFCWINSTTLKDQDLLRMNKVKVMRWR